MAGSHGDLPFGACTQNKNYHRNYYGKGAGRVREKEWESVVLVKFTHLFSAVKRLVLT